MTFFSKMTEVTPHITFACIVNGTKLTASLTHLEDTGVLTLYHVSFSDGHRGAYAPGDASMQGGTAQSRTRDKYHAAIASDLCIIHTFLKMRERSLTNFRVYEKGGESFNIWIYELRGYYSVYYKSGYQFTLRKRDRWEVSTKKEKGIVINQQLASLISQHLDRHWLKLS